MTFVSAQATANVSPWAVSTGHCSACGLKHASQHAAVVTVARSRCPGANGTQASAAGPWENEHAST